MKNERGQTLIQTLVAFGLMGILLAGMVMIFSTQAKESRAIGEKLASLEAERWITQALTNNSVCTGLLAAANLVNTTSIPISNATAITAAAPYTIELKTIGGPTGPVTLGNQVSPLSNSLFVKATGGIQLVLSSPTTALLKVNFEQSKLVRTIKDLSFLVTLANDLPTNPTTITITGCGGSNVGQLAGTFSGAFNTALAGSFSCPASSSNVAYSSTPVNYTALGKTLVVSAYALTTAYAGCGIYYRIHVSGPSLNTDYDVAYAGNMINPGAGNIAAAGSRTFVLNSNPGDVFTFQAKLVTTSPSGVAASGTYSTDGSLTILDYY